MFGRLAKLVTRLSVVLVMVATLSGTAVADTPRQWWRHTDFTFRSPGASAVCGFDIFVHILGDGRATVFYKDDLIVSEVDSAVHTTITVFAPSTGKSYSWAYAGALYQYYTPGAPMDSYVRAITTGLNQRYPAGVDAGREVWDAVVFAYDEGVPIIDLVNKLSDSGAQLPVSVAQARCDAVK